MRTHALAEVFCFIFTVCEWSGKFISLMHIHLLTHSLTCSNACPCPFCGCVYERTTDKISCVLCYYCGLLSYLSMVTSLQWIAIVVCPFTSSIFVYSFFVSLFHCTIIIITPSTRFTLDAITDSIACMGVYILCVH